MFAHVCANKKLMKFSIDSQWLQESIFARYVTPCLLCTVALYKHAAKLCSNVIGRLETENSCDICRFLCMETITTVISSHPKSKYPLFQSECIYFYFFEKNPCISVKKKKTPTQRAKGPESTLVWLYKLPEGPQIRFRLSFWFQLF